MLLAFNLGIVVFPEADVDVPVAVPDVPGAHPARPQVAARAAREVPRTPLLSAKVWTSWRVEI